MNQREFCVELVIFVFQVIQHQKYLIGRRIGVYLSLPDEIQTDSILKHMFSFGKTCFIPRYV